LQSEVRSIDFITMIITCRYLHSLGLAGLQGWMFRRHLSKYWLRQI